MISGSPTLVIDGEDHPVEPETFARLDPRAAVLSATTGPSRARC